MFVFFVYVRICVDVCGVVYSSSISLTHSSSHLTCYCLPTPLTLASRGIAIWPLAVHQPASPSIWPVWSVHKSCVLCECYRVVMDVIWRRLCVSMI